jgi:hypothetical protein
MPVGPYTYLEIIFLYNFVLNTAKISIYFNSNYLSCFRIDICLQNKIKKRKKIKS